MRARDRGYRQGYRAEIRGLHLDWSNVNGKWWDGYAAGMRDAATDLDWRRRWDPKSYEPTAAPTESETS